MRHPNWPLTPTLACDADSLVVIEFVDLAYNFHYLTHDNIPWFTLATMALRSSMCKVNNIESDFDIAESVAHSVFGASVQVQKIQEMYVLLSRMTRRINDILGKGIAAEWNVVFRRGSPTKVVIAKSGLEHVIT